MQVNTHSQSTTISLFCSFLNEKQEVYFQSKKLPSPLPLTVADVKKSLNNRKIEPITTSLHTYTNKVEVEETLLYLFFTAVCIGYFELLFTHTMSHRFPSASTFDPITRLVSIPDFTYTVFVLGNNNSIYHKTYSVPYRLGGYGYYDDLPTNGTRILSNSILSILPPFILLKLIYAALITPFYKSIKNSSENKILNKKIDNLLNHLSFQGDEQSEINSKDAAKAFPYLTDTDLKKFNFKQLQKVYKKFPEIFAEKLKKSLFSSEQLAIWRLFQRFLKAENQEKELILQEPLNQEIIASCVDFFEFFVRSIKDVSNKKIRILATLLKSKILITEVADRFKNKKFKNIVKSIHRGESLKKIIDLKLFSRQNLFSLSSEEDKDFLRFSRFLQTGKLKLQEPMEVVTFIKMAKEVKLFDVITWLSSYFSSILKPTKNIHEIIEILRWAREEGLENLILIIDFFFKRWLDRDFDQLPLDAFKQAIKAARLKKLYLLAKEEELFIFAQGLRDQYAKWVELLEFDGRSSVQDYLNDFEYFFGEDDWKYRELLKEKINDYLFNSPEEIEELANQAEENDCGWLKEVIGEVFEKNRDLFLPHWLTPYETP